MSITKEQAATWFETMHPPGSGAREMYRMAAKALRPVSREQVEKVWRGEWIKHNGYTECSKCEYWYPSTEDEEEDDRNSFCPRCGAPMTDEAVDMVMERLEKIK